MRKIILTFVCCLAAILSGCFSSPDRDIRYYTLPVLENVKTAENPVYPYTLLVTHASIDPSYRRNNIVYRETPYDFMYYTYSAWASRPEFLIEQVAKNYIRSKGLFMILENSDVKKPDLEFAIHVYAVEEVDKGEDRYAHLSVLFALQKTDAEEFVWRKNYEASKKYDSSDMRNFAEAISEILEGFLVDAVEETRKNLK